MYDHYFVGGRPNTPLTGNPVNDTGAVIAVYEIDGKLSDRDVRVLVDATRQLDRCAHRRHSGDGPHRSRLAGDPRRPERDPRRDRKTNRQIRTARSSLALARQERSDT